MECITHKIKPLNAAALEWPTTKENARDIGMCAPQPDNHTAWSRILSTGYIYYICYLKAMQA